MSSKAKVIYLHQLDPQAALERLNRLTGLQFTSWPKSLKPAQQERVSAACGLAEGVAISQGVGEGLAAAESLDFVALDASALL
ncbi:MAG: hypothetical protein Q8R10_00710 [Pseudomonas sp.]|uniref:hypothetical protein n=1 Tax=Pseudomonas sp. TaxID=306 RepID=UPI0027339B34|nr:hypothetical protein [Pseudomonas sp.]MDP3844939.1 hypothetical protein [Pseudomonas sp.]